MSALQERREDLRCAIKERAFVTASEATIISRRSKSKKTEGWLFDVRNILLESNAMEDIAALFYHEFAAVQEFQIGGLETAGIALTAGLVAHAHVHGGRQNMSGFFIRKSRKKDGLTKAIEGNVRPGLPIILVDDLINSGSSILRQLEVLEAAGHQVSCVWTLMRFRDDAFYHFLRERHIELRTLFTLDDFEVELAPKATREAVNYEPWRVIWEFRSPNPSYFHVVPKSTPTIDEDRVYMGSDSGVFWAINKGDGSLAWSFETGSHPKGKGIFSTPIVHAGTVYFGAYDGNVYALDSETGKKKWVFDGADWVGSSPAISVDRGLLFIGLEFGLWRKKGGIVALELATGEPAWRNRMPCYVHSTPLYLKEHGQVVIGSNDGAAYLFDASTGALVWRSSPHELTETELETGFGESDIKASFAYDSPTDRLFVGRKDGSFAAIERKTGREVATFKAEFGIYATPIIFEDMVIFTSLDKNVYALDKRTFEEKWRWNAGARIFCSPTVIENTLYVGANTGRLTSLEPTTGKPLGYFVVSERITNPPVYDTKSKRYFLSTFANEVYCLEKKKRYDE